MVVVFRAAESTTVSDSLAGLGFHCKWQWQAFLGREYHARQENVLRDRGVVSLGRCH